MGADYSPVARNENTRTAGNKYGYPKEYSGMHTGTVSLQALENLFHAGPKKPREHKRIPGKKGVRMILKNFLKLHTTSKGRNYCVSIRGYIEEKSQDEIEASEIFKKIANKHVKSFDICSYGNRAELMIYLKDRYGFTDFGPEGVSCTNIK